MVMLVEEGEWSCWLRRENGHGLRREDGHGLRRENGHVG